MRIFGVDFGNATVDTAHIYERAYKTYGRTHNFSRALVSETRARVF